MRSFKKTSVPLSRFTGVTVVVPHHQRVNVFLNHVACTFCKKPHPKAWLGAEIYLPIFLYHLEGVARPNPIANKSDTKEMHEIRWVTDYLGRVTNSDGSTLNGCRILTKSLSEKFHL